MTRVCARRTPLVPLAGAVLVVFAAFAGRPVAQPQPADRFAVRDATIPMRDGVRLHVKIYTPKDQREPLPIIMLRTPYGIEGSAGHFARSAGS